MRRFLVLCLLGLAAPAQASEIFGGLLAHDVNTPLTPGGLADGAGVQLGWRRARRGPRRACGWRAPLPRAALAQAQAPGGVPWGRGGRGGGGGGRPLLGSPR